MIIEQIKTGGDRNFGYVVIDESSKQAALIDPSFSPEKLVEFSFKRNFIVRYNFNTHNHYDHSNGNQKVQELTGIRPLMYGEIDRPSGVQVLDGSLFEFGDMSITVIHTPGHTDDSICLFIGDALFTGDTLFVGKVGGTDFGKQARAEYNSLHEKLMKLPDNTRIFPGHDYGTAPESTIGHERTTNPFLILPDFESFLELKRNWLEYKREHGIE
ncbi:hydroxyacylglutathione hydrolase family protein [candidate division KSB1 bacterium]